MTFCTYENNERDSALSHLKYFPYREHEPCRSHNRWDSGIAQSRFEIIQGYLKTKILNQTL